MSGRIVRRQSVDLRSEDLLTPAERDALAVMAVASLAETREARGGQPDAEGRSEARIAAANDAVSVYEALVRWAGRIRLEQRLLDEAFRRSGARATRDGRCAVTREVHLSVIADAVLRGTLGHSTYELRDEAGAIPQADG
jgi:hypothetical protein